MDYEVINKCNLLEQMLLDANKEPTDLPLSLLKDITNNFSDDRKIGSGGFAVVYEGLLDNGSVAVKRLSEALDMDEKNFNKEVSSLIRVKHKNIVRFLGYCADTQGKLEMYNDKMVMADVRQRLLCFEFMPNGGLDKHINDTSKGLDWRTSYQIIKGICHGLHYLHQQNIVHLDLKPANILLDGNMVPKIADFGLSKCFDEKQTRVITSNLVGTMGYMAPESYSGVITFKSDIYSLGIIITEILTGKKEYLQSENVLESWSTRFQTSRGGTWLQHVRVCSEIALECMDSDPVKRPMTGRIIETLDELERTYGSIEIDISVGQVHSMGSSDLVIRKPLDAYPPELRFHFEPNKRIKLPVTLTNRTNHQVGVLMTPTHPNTHSRPGVLPFLWGDERKDDLVTTSSSIFFRMDPHSSTVIYSIMKEQQQPPLQASICMFKVVMMVVVSEEFLNFLQYYLIRNIEKNNFEDSLKSIKSMVTQVHRELLTVIVTCDPERCQEAVIHQFIPDRQDLGSINSIDIHPTETWVLVGHNESGYFSIWNYDTQDRFMVFKVTDVRNDLWTSISSTKFIAEEQWFAVGDSNGWVHVYSYATKDKVKEFQHHKHELVTQLTVHPTDPLLLTASSTDGLIKFWDWSQGWTCARILYMGSNVYDLTVGPQDTNIFAYRSSNDDVQVCHFHSSDPVAKLASSHAPTFYTDCHRHFLVTCPSGSPKYGDIYAYIWDLQTKKLVHRLCVTCGVIWLCSVACHPTLPILAAVVVPPMVISPVTRKADIYLWDARTYR